MSITSHHPKYDAMLDKWRRMEDAYAGEDKIKEGGLKYLPSTPAQELDGMSSGEKGYKNYQNYRTRANFPDIVYTAIDSVLGVMHSKPATIELPEKMESLRERVTVKGESMQMLLRKINQAQLTTGRLGLFTDVEDGAGPKVLPYIVMYGTEDIINWDDTPDFGLANQNLCMVVLNESENLREDEFEWQVKEKYRVLIMGDVSPDNNEGFFKVGVYNEDTSYDYSEELMMEPSIGGNKLKKIPFTFINSRDIIADPDKPPLLGLANLALTIYHGDADYRNSLFMQGQDTLVITGSTVDGDDDVRVGAGARIDIAIGGDAKYIGVNSKGLPEMRTALENDKKEAADLSGKLLDTRGGQAESGEALRIRVSARTASLHQIALTGATGLQTQLRIMAEWIGADPNEVIVTPNTDFADNTLEGKNLLDYVAAKTLGAPWSWASLHQLMQERDLTKMTFDEEKKVIESEVGLDFSSGGDGTGVEEDDDNGANED
ncbi:MAG: DUF4055 domain-containing protein [Candidatus Sabulitectum sp.]|nr:DUF4055 domain-containing protein [Candidatus Sabulitectum sp.]